MSDEMRYLRTDLDLEGEIERSLAKRCETWRRRAAVADVIRRMSPPAVAAEASDPAPDSAPDPDQALLERVAELMLAWRDRHEPLEKTARAIVAAVEKIATRGEQGDG